MKNNNKASLLDLICVFLVLAAANMVTGVSTEFKVGDNGGWREPDLDNAAMYNQWAAKNRFQVGDSLSKGVNMISFLFRVQDSVLVVDKWGYHHCNTSNPISTFDDGKTVIKLDRPGPFYFISGAPDHCKNGQRLLANVLTLHPTPESPPSIAVPPQPYPTNSPSPSPLPSSEVSVVVAFILISMASAAALVTLVWGAP
ncbi:hypothetical protein HHK36_025610 [Tetracentron sinense]|uniref:Phytocyanin domain-containing protein n=1 Tax=Tetracentron sinense TaxID=13715 RepID=A0A834YLJ8_TETSI|nr:hypothetical protein HHK36_025610 [Tetracentron sinense]